MSPKNIILITIDALRASDAGCIGGGKLTPNIDALSKESVLFKEAISNGPGTPQSFPSIFASVYPLMNEKIILSKKYVTLAQVLRENNFLTAGFHSNPFLSDFFGWNRGFQIYEELIEYSDILPKLFRALTRRSGIEGLPFKPLNMLQNYKSVRKIIRRIYSLKGERLEPYVKGEILNRAVLNWFKEEYNKKDRFFLWMHYMDPHEPYFPPNSWLNVFGSIKEASEINLKFFTSKKLGEKFELVQKAKQLYDLEVNYVDHCIGNLLNKLNDGGFIEDTMIVLTSDHGEAFNEHGNISHPAHILYEEVLRVPLIINGIDKTEVAEDPIGLINLSPMILKHLGINNPKTFIGDNITKTHKPIISESAKFDYVSYKYDFERNIISYRTKKWKLIINNIERKTELYNLKRDPKEQENTSDCNKDIVKDFIQKIKCHINQLKRARIDT